jgi:hypothetical protein
METAKGSAGKNRVLSPCAISWRSPPPTRTSAGWQTHVCVCNVQRSSEILCYISTFGIHRPMGNLGDTTQDSSTVRLPTQDMMSALSQNVWSLLRHTADIRSGAVSFNRGEGTYLTHLNAELSRIRI